MRSTAGGIAVVASQGFQCRFVVVGVGVADLHRAHQTNPRGNQAVLVTLIGDRDQVGQTAVGIRHAAVLGDQAIGEAKDDVDGVCRPGFAARGGDRPGAGTFLCADGGGDTLGDEHIGFTGIPAEIAIQHFARVAFDQPGTAG